MRTRPDTARRKERRCSYVVLADRITSSPDELRNLAMYGKPPKYPDLIRALSERLATIERRSA